LLQLNLIRHPDTAEKFHHLLTVPKSNTKFRKTGKNAQLTLNRRLWKNNQTTKIVNKIVIFPSKLAKNKC
jgi:hypothetical protein